MGVYKQPKSKYWWYKFNWNGEPIRETTKQTNKRVAVEDQGGAGTSAATERGNAPHDVGAPVVAPGRPPPGAQQVVSVDQVRHVMVIY